MEKLSRRLFLRVLPGVAAAFGLAAKAKPAIVVDGPVSGVEIMARARADRGEEGTTIQRLLDGGWTPRYYMRAKIGHTIRFWKTRPFVPYEDPYLWDFEHVLTLDSPAMVDEWNALVDADRKWWEETIASRTVVPQRLHEQDVTGQLEHLFNVPGPKIGRTINVRKPQRFVGREGAKSLAELNFGELQNLQSHPDAELGRTVSIIDPDGTRRQIPLNGVF